jgi:hypothetical protein
MTRRHFLMTNSVLAASAAFGVSPQPRPPAPGVLAGLQIHPLDLLDQGIDATLDFLQEAGAVNALFCYSQTYHLGDSPANVLATDHPRPPRPTEGRALPHLWVRLPEAPFADLAVRHASPPAGAEYRDRDLFSELAAPCRRRGIRLYARILEAGLNRAERVPGYLAVSARDLDGRPVHGPCWNHPDYREWVKRTVEYLMRQYPLDGLQYGAERVGALSDVLFKGGRASCFCEHCRRRNASAGIDPDRAAAGYRELETLVGRASRGEPHPTDGLLTAVIRVLFRHPEVLAFYDQWLKADTEIHELVYKAAKAVRPEADVGQHVDHQRSSWDILFRAAVPYADMTGHNDFIKPILYHEILGPRLQQWVIDAMKQRVLAEIPRQTSLDLFYAVFGLNPAQEPSYDALAEQGLSPDYVFRETRRCVEGVAGKARVYAGIGLDIPHYVPGGMRRIPSRPESVQAATTRALDAGAAGVLASREFREMSRPSLEAFARAVRDRPPA